MTRCPYCNVRLPKGGGKLCPNCGTDLTETVLYSDSERRTVEHKSPATPESGDATGEESLNTTGRYDSQDADPYDYAPYDSDQQLPDPGVSSTDTFDSDGGDPYAFSPYESDDGKSHAQPDDIPDNSATDTFDEDDSEAAEEIRSLWSDAVEDDSSPDVRIKPAGETISARTHVVVKPKSLAQPGKTDVPGADFQLLSILGEGGMGTVYEARQTSVDRTIAVKMIKPHLASNRRQRDKFLAEAAVTGELDHPNIVPVHDLGANEDGCLYYAMKRVQGTPWDEVIKSNTLEQNLDILLRTSDAVAYAHAKGVIHRDLKPQNVMLGEFGETLLMDWGLAAAVSDQGKAPLLTRANAAGGTPAYMAPEMALADVKKIGLRSDVYLLGAILFEIITGRRPHTGKKVLDCLLAAGTNTIVETDVQGELMQIARKAMATEPDDRYPSVKAFQDAIRNYQSHAESVRVCQQASGDLAEARSSRSYDSYAQAIYGMHEALKLWDGNAVARAGLASAQYFYAECAYENGDLDLAASQLNPEIRRHAVLAERIEKARAERIARQRRLKVFTITAGVLAASIFVILAVSYVLIRSERNKAIQARNDEVKQRRLAEQQRENAITASLEEKKQRTIAERQRAIAESEKEKAVAARQAEEEQRRLAEAASEKAKAAEARAVDALEAMMIARSKEEEAKAKEQAAKIMAAKAQTELARTGMLLDNTWWTFDAAEAAKRQKDAATKTGWPVRQTLSLPGNVKLQMVLIPAGEFVMGSPPEEQKRAGVEYLHRVEITRPFYIGTHELTEAQWKAVVGKAPFSARERDINPTLPVTEVSWTDVKEKLLPALKRHAPDGFEFTLPTEAEWEYACRAGTHTAYYNGTDEEDLKSAGWYLFNSDRKVHPGGEKVPNPWGLYDLHGNVSEWCRDVYDAGWYVRSPVKDPLRDGDEPRRVNRGGGCLNLSHHCRSAYRSWAHADNRYKFLGVRLVLRKPR